MSPAFAFALGCLYTLCFAFFVAGVCLSTRRSERIANSCVAVGIVALAVIRFLTLLRP